MNRICFSLLLFMLSLPVFTQETNSKIPLDSLYREDQFYASLTYNLAQQKPRGYSQRGFSTGLAFGFLRDMPINKNRTYAIAAGLGYSFNSFKHNLKISQSASGTVFEVVDAGDFDKNKLELHYLDVPLEIRWRQSTTESHKFWRIYTGFKLSYVLASKAVFENSLENQKILGIEQLNKVRYGAYVTVGWNAWNLYAYYGFNPMFKSGKTGNENVTLNSFNLGVMFYIL